MILKLKKNNKDSLSVKFSRLNYKVIVKNFKI